MARPKSGDKPSDIRSATVNEVAAIGSTAVSVNKIAARASVSVGTIYRYYRSKDDLLFSVFVDVKRDIHDTMMRAAKAQRDSESRLRAMWFALVDHGFRAPRDFQFVEMMSSETRIEFDGIAELERISAEVLGEIQRGVDDGTLVDVDARTIETVLASPAITLARRAALRGQRIEHDEVDKIFSLIWRGISRKRGP